MMTEAVEQVEATQAPPPQEVQAAPPPGIDQVDVSTVLLHTAQVNDTDYSLINSRTEEPKVTDVRALALDILRNGQQQPIRVAVAGDGSYRLVFGQHRLLAVRLINDEKLYKDKDLTCALPIWEGKGYPVRAEVVSADTGQSFLLNLAENLRRKGLNAIDQAHSMNRLVTEYGMNQKAVSKRFGLSVGQVSGRIKLLQLPKDLQGAIRHGRLSAVAALEALAYDAGTDERAAGIAQIRESLQAERKPTQHEVRRKTRKKGKEEDDPKAKYRTLRELTSFWEGLATPAEGADIRPKVQEFAKSVVRFHRGKMGERAMLTVLAEAI